MEERAGKMPPRGFLESRLCGNDVVLLFDFVGSETTGIPGTPYRLDVSSEYDIPGDPWKIESLPKR